MIPKKICGNKEQVKSSITPSSYNELAITESGKVIIISDLGYQNIPKEKLYSEDIITKEKFIHLIDKIISYRKKIEAIDKVLKDNCEDSIFCPPTLEYELVSLLSSVMEDSYDAIGTFIYDLSCGEKWTNNSFVVNGKDIKLSTTDDLYNFLVKEKE